ncbi:MAG: hypothetical protein ACJ790_15670 [Myxococcaceae bacterium]
MFEVTANVAKNLITLRLEGVITQAELVKAGEEMLQAIDRLRPGLDFLADVRFVESTPEFEPAMSARVADKFRQRSLRRIVRVVGKKAQVAVKFEKASKVFGFSANLAYSMEEAERLLDAHSG